MSQTIRDLENTLQWLADNHGKPGVPEYAYVEVGRYKPFHPSIVAAATRRGYRVERLGQSAYAVYPTLAEVASAHQEPVQADSEALPALGFSLTLTGTVAPDGEEPDQRDVAMTASELRHNLHAIVERAMCEGLFTADTPATVESHEVYVEVFKADEQGSPAPALEVAAEIESARPLVFGHVDIQSGDRLCRLDDALACVEAAAAGDWMPGIPPRGVKVAWLRTVCETPDGPHDSTVLGICDSEGVWCEAGRWQADDALDQIEGEISHWMPYGIPSPRLGVAAYGEKPIAQLRAEVEAGLAELLRRADEPLAINYGPNVYLEVCPPRQYGERVEVFHREFGWTCVNYTNEGLILDVFGKHDLESLQSYAFDKSELTQDDDEQDEAAKTVADVKDWGEESTYQITLTEVDGTATVDHVRTDSTWGAELICRTRYPGCQIADIERLD